MRKNRISKKDIIISGAIILLILIVVLNLYFVQKAYKMELYVLGPDNTEMKIKECNSDSPDFECTSNYPCTEGTYARAITSMLGSVISDTDWKKMC